MGTNTILIILVVLSSIINVGLGRKVQTLQRVMQSSANKSSIPAIVGARLTSLDVKNIDGHSMNLTFDQSATPTFIYVFRTTCGWCAKNLSNIKELDRLLRLSGKGQIIGLSLDDQGLKTYVQNAQLPFPIYEDLTSSEVARLGLGGTPQTLVVSNGTIVHNWKGAYSGSLLNEIQSTLGVKLPCLQ